MFLSPGESLDGDRATCMFIFLICYLLQAKEWEPWISNSYRTKLETSCCLHLSFGRYSNTYVPIVSFFIFSLICQREIFCNFAADRVHPSMPSILINCNSIRFYVSGWRMYWPESIFVICMHQDGAKRFLWSKFYHLQSLLWLPTVLLDYVMLWPFCCHFGKFYEF